MAPSRACHVSPGARCEAWRANSGELRNVGACFQQDVLWRVWRMRIWVGLIEHDGRRYGYGGAGGKIVGGSGWRHMGCAS